jgi:hypothetical protein
MTAVLAESLGGCACRHGAALPIVSITSVGRKGRTAIIDIHTP